MNRNIENRQNTFISNLITVSVLFSKCFYRRSKIWRQMVQNFLAIWQIISN